MEGKRPKGRPRIRWMDQIRRNMEMKGKNWEVTRKQEVGVQTAGDFSVIVDPYLWKLFKNDDDDEHLKILP